MAKKLGNLSDYEILRQIAKALTSTRDLEQILEMIMDTIGTLYSPENWSLVLVDREKGDLYFGIAVGAAAESLKEKRLQIGEGIIGWTIQYGESVILENPYEDERFARCLDTESGFKTETIITVPLISNDEPLGGIELINIDTRYFAENHITLLQALADFAAIAIENVRYIRQIRDLSIRDDCTHLYNARHMKDILDREISRAQRDGVPFSVVFLDLDRFKNVNDTYGHLVGSNLLREVAFLIVGRLRPTDWTFRYGGDEFVMILPGLDREAALQVTCRIRDLMNSTCFSSREGHKISITASFGIATFPEDAATQSEIIRLADQAMYSVKESGRNNVLHTSQIKT